MNIDESDIFNYQPLELTARERRRIAILLVETEASVRISMRQALVSLGYDNIYDSSDPAAAIERMEERHFSHVIFEAKNAKLPAREFLAAILEKNEDIIALASSYEPTVDDVFNLLIGGAKGFVVKPFTAGTLEESISWATKGDPITEAIRDCRNRNEALAMVILSSLDKLALVMRQSRRFETAKLEIPKKTAHLVRAITTGRTFAKGGIPRLREAIVDAAIQRSTGPGGRGGTIRRRARRNEIEIPDPAVALPVPLKEHQEEDNQNEEEQE